MAGKNVGYVVGRNNGQRQVEQVGRELCGEGFVARGKEPKEKGKGGGGERIPGREIGKVEGAEPQTP